MFYPNFVETVPQLNQAYNVANDIDDDNDCPPECRLHSRSLDDKPAEYWDDQRDEHNDYEHLLSLLYRQGIKATRLS